MLTCIIALLVLIVIGVAIIKTNASEIKTIDISDLNFQKEDFEKQMLIDEILKYELVKTGESEYTKFKRIDAETIQE